MLRACALALGLIGASAFITHWPALLHCPELVAAGLGAVWLLAGPAWCLGAATAAWVIAGMGWALNERLDPVLERRDVAISGVICSFPRRDGRATRFVFCIDGATRRATPLPSRVNLSSYGALPAAPAAAQRWRLRVRLRRPRGLANPGGFDFERWALERRIGASGYVRESPLNMRLPLGTRGAPLLTVRRLWADEIAAHLPGDPATKYLRAIAVGARDGLHESDWTLLRRTGTVHLMAISGLHIGFVAMSLYRLGRRLAAIAGRWRSRAPPVAVGRALGLTGAAAYAALAGFTVPTVRALVMVAAGLMLATAGRRVGGWRILAAALLAVLWVDPLAWLGSGFWLSFGAVAILLLATLALPLQPVTGIARAAARVRATLGAQLALWLGLAPLVVAFFAEWSLVAPLANLLVVPPFAFLVMPLTLAALVLLPVAVVPAGWLLAGAAWVQNLILSILRVLAELDGAVWQPVWPGYTLLAAAGTGALLLAWPRPLRCRWIGLVPLVMLAAPLFAVRGPALRVVVMDVGQGLAVLVQTPGHALVYDAGPRFGSRDAGASVVVPVLRRYGVQRLDTLMISHGDNDHAGGARSVLDRYPGARLISTDRKITHSLRTACARGLAWTWDTVHFEVLNPDPAKTGRDASDNNRSCVLSIRTARAAVLLPGDIERDAERMLAGDGVLRPYDIVVAPHHGSRTSSSPKFVSAVDPAAVIFPAGFGNRWHFPADAVRRRWERGGACTFTTGQSGALIFETDAAGRLRLIAEYRDAHRFRWNAEPVRAGRCTAL